MGGAVLSAPRGYAGRRHRSAAGADKKRAAGLMEYVPADVVRRCLRPKWETAGQWPPMEEDAKGGLLDLTKAEIIRLELAFHRESISIGSSLGWPDLTVWGPGGLILRELKGSDGRVKMHQLRRVEALRAAGLDACFWWPEDWYDGTITAELIALSEPRPGVVPLPPLAAELTALGALLADAPPLPRAVAEALKTPPARRPGDPVWTPGYRACGCPMEGDHLQECPRYGRRPAGAATKELRP